MTYMPRQKPGLTFHDMENEVLLYDPDQELAYCLNTTAAQVLRMCDGTTTLADAGSRMGTTPAGADLLALTLKSLENQRLLIDPLPVMGLTRRQFIGKWGKMVAVLPLVAMVAAPLPAAAISVGTNDATAHNGSDDEALAHVVKDDDPIDHGNPGGADGAHGQDFGPLGSDNPNGGPTDPPGFIEPKDFDPNVRGDLNENLDD